MREDLSLFCDRDLLVALLTQYIDNAGKYATAGTIITIEAVEHTKEVVFSVHSVGPVIPVSIAIESSTVISVVQFPPTRCRARGSGFL